jgi:DNA repair protein RadC
VSIGSLSSSLAHPREVFKPAILANAAAIILGHNHPSGEPTPSREDVELTKRLKEGAELLGIRLLDHIVIGDEKWFSFSEDGSLSQLSQ